MTLKQKYESLTADINGVKLHYLKAGTGEKVLLNRKTVVF
jgi:hypothetical protein